MSTRVHEFAKELGLKSPELLERIQKWGLDVKANAMASLDPPMVDQIRKLMDQPASGTEATTLAAQHRPRRHATHGVVGRRRRGGRRIAAHWTGGRWIGVNEPGAHRTGPRSCTGTGAAGRVPAVDRRPAAIDPRLISRRIGPTSGIDRLRGCACTCARSTQRATSGAVGVGVGPPVSPRRLLRNSAHRRPAFGPYDASRSEPPARRRAHVSRTSPATRAQDRSSFVPAVFLAQFGIVRLSTAETRRLHVVGGNPPDGSEGRPLVGPVNRTASARRRRRW